MLEREQYRYVMRCIEEPPFALHQSCKPLSRPSARTTSCFLGRLLHETCSLGLWKIFSGLVRYRANPCTTSIVLARVPIRRAAVDTSQDRSSSFGYRDVGAMDLVTFLCAMQNSGRDSHFLKSPGPVCSPLPLSAHNPFRNIKKRPGARIPALAWVIIFKHNRRTMDPYLRRQLTRLPLWCKATITSMGFRSVLVPLLAYS